MFPKVYKIGTLIVRMDKQIRFKDLSWVIKTTVIYCWFGIIILGISFIVGLFGF